MANADDSNLASPEYGFDYVVATTQAGINATMKGFMHSLAPEYTIQCFVQKSDTDTTPVEIDFQTLKEKAGGADPFTISPNATFNGTDPDSKALQALNSALFLHGFKTALGLPAGVLPADIPDIIKIHKNGKQVEYRMLCSEFIVVSIDFTRNGPTWRSLSQPVGTGWDFVADVDLDLVDATGTLPADVADAVKNMSANAFSVQQLLFDFNTAALSTVPKIEGLASGTDTFSMVTNFFISEYFPVIQKKNLPSLQYSVKHSQVQDPATLPLTDLNIELMVYPCNKQPGDSAGDPDLNTVNYLCATNHHTLPSPRTFGWNWMTPADKSLCHGIISTNSNTFLGALADKLKSSLVSCAQTPKCYVHCNFVSITLKLSFDLPQEPLAYNVLAESDRRLADGFTSVLSCTWHESSSDSSTFVPNWGNMNCDYYFTSTVSVSDRQLKVVSNITIHIHVNTEGGVTEGNFANFTSTSVCNLVVGSDGRMQAISTGEPAVVDKSENISTNIWSSIVSFGEVNNVIDSEKQFAKNFATSMLSDLNSRIGSVLNGPRSWFFPGGQTFTYKDCRFSKHQDLLTSITFADPAGH